ncbi:MAG: histidinol-phosphate transaminase [Marinifilaceae bacterium]
MNERKLLGIDPMSFVRNNLKTMQAYSSARDEYDGSRGVFLDANESPYGNGLNRYPDPHQKDLKARIAQLKGVDAQMVFLGNGSDEVIDLLYRGFCRPGVDNVIICSPTYGMYRVAAELNDIEVREVMLDQNFQPDITQVLGACDDQTRMLFLCSPNNPTGNLLNAERVELLLERFPGLVVLDEAYIDFAPNSSLLMRLENFQNLVVLQTFSKAWGLAGIRLGIGFAHPQVVALLSKIKLPYNVNVLSQQKALKALGSVFEKETRVKSILSERFRLEQELSVLDFVENIYSSQANFLLVKVDNAKRLYRFLIQKGVVVRDRSGMSGLAECLRISVGTPDENSSLLEALKGYEKDGQ